VDTGEQIRAQENYWISDQ